MIRFSAFLVVVAVGLLVAGVVTSKLMLVYLAIAVSGIALLALGVGAAVKRRELFGSPQAAASDVGAQEPVPALVPQAPTSLVPTSLAPVPQQPVPQQPVPQQPPPWAPTSQPPVPQAQPEDYPRPAAVPPRTSQPRPGAARNRPAETVSQTEAAAAAVAWESARPPTGVFPAVRPAAEAPDTRAAEHSQAGTSRSPRPATAHAAPETAQSAASIGNAASAANTASAANAASAAPAAPETVAEPTKSKSADPESTTASPDPKAPGPDSKPASPEPAAAVPEPAPQPATDAPAPASAGLDPKTTVTVVPGVPRYHNASCILTRFMGEKDLQKMTLAAARRAGCTPCRACLPDQLDKQPKLFPRPVRRGSATGQTRQSQNVKPSPRSACSAPTGPTGTRGSVRPSTP